MGEWWNSGKLRRGVLGWWMGGMIKCWYGKGGVGGMVGSCGTMRWLDGYVVEWRNEGWL